MLHAVTDSSRPKRTTSKRRPRSVLAKIGEEGRREAQRKALLEALEAANWYTIGAAEALGVNPAAMHALMTDLIRPEYDAAVADGRISHGKRAPSKE